MGLIDFTLFLILALKGLVACYVTCLTFLLRDITKVRSYIMLMLRYFIEPILALWHLVHFVAIVCSVHQVNSYPMNMLIDANFKTCEF